MNQRKLAIHWQGPIKFDYPAGVVKVMDPGINDPAPGKDKVVRFYIPDDTTNEWIDWGVMGVQRWWEWIRPQIIQILHWSGQLIIEGPNEPQPMDSWLFRKNLDDFYVDATALIEKLASSVGRKIYLCAYNWSVGWPGWGDITDFRKSLRVVHFAASHEYNAPDVYRVGDDGTPCWTGRFLEIFQEIREAHLRTPPWLITEFAGVDHLLRNKYDPESYIGGWQTVNNDPIQYAQQIRWAIDNYYSKEHKIKAVFLYTGSPYHPWETYEATEPLMAELLDYAADHLPVPKRAKKWRTK